MTSRRRDGGTASRTRPPRPPPSLVCPISVVTLIAAVGVLVASAAYAAGRHGYASSPWANRAYWLGQALIVAPVAERLLSRRRLSPTGSATLVIVLTVAEYLLKVCYSPLSFAFTDELLHWRSTVNLIQTGKLFTVNYGLPISPRYPGLEEVTSALISVTGLPIFVAGLIVAGVAHLLFICLLYLTFQFVSRSHRVGGIAVLVYSSTPTLNSFDAMFVYETLALAFLGLSLLAAWRAATGRSRGERGRSFMLAVLAIFATVMTHHVTSYMLVGLAVPGRARQPAHPGPAHRAHGRHARRHFCRLGGLLGDLRRARHARLLPAHARGARGGHQRAADRELLARPVHVRVAARQPATGRHRDPGHHYPAAARLVAGLAAAPLPSVGPGHGDGVARLVRRAGHPRRHPRRPGTGRAHRDLRLHPGQPDRRARRSSSWPTSRWPGAGSPRPSPSP